MNQWHRLLRTPRHGEVLFALIVQPFLIIATLREESIVEEEILARFLSDELAIAGLHRLNLDAGPLVVDLFDRPDVSAANLQHLLVVLGSHFDFLVEFRLGLRPGVHHVDVLEAWSTS